MSTLDLSTISLANHCPILDWIATAFDVLVLWQITNPKMGRDLLHRSAVTKLAVSYCRDPLCMYTELTIAEAFTGSCTRCVSSHGECLKMPYRHHRLVHRFRKLATDETLRKTVSFGRYPHFESVADQLLARVPDPTLAGAPDLRVTQVQIKASQIRGVSECGGRPSLSAPARGLARPRSTRHCQ